MLDTMTPKNPRWAEFVTRLEGPEGCNFREHPKYPGDPGHFTWDCDANDRTCPHARAILKAMGATETEIINSILFFSNHGGFCDCEILYNVEASCRRGPVHRAIRRNPAKSKKSA